MAAIKFCRLDTPIICTGEGINLRRFVVTGWDVKMFFFSSRRRHTRSLRDWSSDVCSSDLRVLPLEHEGLGYPFYQFYGPFLFTISGYLYKFLTHVAAVTHAGAFLFSDPLTTMKLILLPVRSEERRVGKECSCGWGRYSGER